MNSIKVKVGKDYIFELRDIEVYERMSEETTAFFAYIYLNGQRIGFCRNSGQGEGNYPSLFSQCYPLYAEFEKEVCKYRYHEDNYYGRTIDWDYNTDFLIGMMISDFYYNHNETYKL